MQFYAPCQRLYQLLTADAVSEEAICIEIQRVRNMHPEHNDILNAFGMCEADFLVKWDANRDEAAHRGTWMHYQMECWLNRVPMQINSTELQLLIDYTYSLGGLTAYRTEWAIYADEENLAGSIDFIAVNLSLIHI